MRSARDTFLHFIADNTSGVTVRNLRRDSTNPGLSLLETNAINLQFIGDSLAVIESEVTVNIDVVHEDELTAIDITRSLVNLLQQTGYTRLQDYSSGTPVPLSVNLFWDQDAIRFSPVFDLLYFRYGCSLPVKYHLFPNIS